jgi:hypothetical protein
LKRNYVWWYENKIRSNTTGIDGLLIVFQHGKAMSLLYVCKVESYRVVRCRGAHIFLAVGSHMVVRLSALQAGRALLP